MTYTDYGYRDPGIEAAAQYLRAQISLNDQQFAAFMQGLYVQNLTSVFANQQTATDMDVKGLQVALLKRILVPPMSGTVTRIYKQAGDVLRAGEPVVRVENNSTLLLTGILIYRESLPIGTIVTVQTSQFSSTTPQNISGTIVVARGHESGDDRWAVVISCTNPTDANGNSILPPNYRFDFDDTTVTVGSISVPKVVGDTQAAATTAITGAGLTVGTVISVPSLGVAGTVLTQSPSGGTLAPNGYPVSLSITAPGAAVPDVVKATQAVATTEITGRGLTVRITEQLFSTTVPSGSVISQNPGAGTVLLLGSAVSLVISLGVPSPVKP